MASFAIIVIGSSFGGVEALRQLAAGLERTIPAALFVAQHTAPGSSYLVEILSRAGTLPVRHACNAGSISPGYIYLAPPNHHLLVEPGFTRLTRGPRENWSRPAIDPLFRSAAKSYGGCVIGVILTGMLNDGSAGLRAVRAAGGIAVVQEPTEAFAPDMPVRALRHAGADFRVRLAEMPRLLQELATQLAPGARAGRADRGWNTIK